MGLLQTDGDSDVERGERHVARSPRCRSEPAEEVGFEPTEPYSGSPLFESGTINHSDTPPPRSIAYAPAVSQDPAASYARLEQMA